MAESVYDFHQRFGVPPVGPGSSPNESLAKLRERLPLLMEEIGEHAGELNRGNLDDAIIEMADVAFIVLGTLLVLDEAGKGASNSVSQKNNSKTADTHIRVDTSGKLVRRSEVG